MRNAARLGLVSMGVVVVATLADFAVAEEVPSPPERPIVPAIVFFPGSGDVVDNATGNLEGPTLTIYDSQSCNAKIAGECALVSFTCDDKQGRGLGITIDAIETDQLMEWLEAEGNTAEGMQIEIKGLTAQNPAVGDISPNDFGAGWKVTFYAPLGSSSGLAIAGSELLVKAVPRNVSLELTDANRSALEQFTELCLSE